MDKIIAHQHTLLARITQLGDNCIKMDQSTITRNSIQTSLTNLDTLWQQFRDQDQVILNTATTDARQDDYFILDLFSDVELEYIIQRGRLLDALDVSTSPSTSPSTSTSKASQAVAATTPQSPVQRIDISTFSGSHPKRTNDKDVSTSLVNDDHSWTDDEMSHHVTASLTGEAAQLTQRRPVTLGKYQCAREPPVHRYEDRREPADAQIDITSAQVHASVYTCHEEERTAQVCLHGCIAWCHHCGTTSRSSPAATLTSTSHLRPEGLHRSDECYDHNDGEHRLVNEEERPGQFCSHGCIAWCHHGTLLPHGSPSLPSTTGLRPAERRRREECWANTLDSRRLVNDDERPAQVPLHGCNAWSHQRTTPLRSVTSLRPTPCLRRADRNQIEESRSTNLGARRLVNLRLELLLTSDSVHPTRETCSRPPSWLRRLVPPWDTPSMTCSSALYHEVPTTCGTLPQHGLQVLHHHSQWSSDQPPLDPLMTTDVVQLWSDSTFALALLQGQPFRWPTYVANRPPEAWTTASPPDISDQERPAKVLHSSLHGCTPIARPVRLRYSTMTHLVRCFVWCLRWANRRRPAQPLPRTSCLRPKDLRRSEECWLYLIQHQHIHKDFAYVRNRQLLATSKRHIAMVPVQDDRSLQRVGGRLRHSLLSSDEQHSLATHAGSPLTLAHLRQRYWTRQGRQQVRKYTAHCQRCRRWRAATVTQMLDNRSHHRVTTTRPFFHSGVDYAGPFRLQSTSGRCHKTIKGSKARFVFFSAGAVLLKVANDHATFAFLIACRPFTSRQGLGTQETTDGNAHDERAAQEPRRLFAASSTEAAVIGHHLTMDGLASPDAQPVGCCKEAAIRSGEPSSTTHHRRRYPRPHGVLHPLRPEDFHNGGPFTASSKPPTTNTPRSGPWRRCSADSSHQLQHRRQWIATQTSTTIENPILIGLAPTYTSKWPLTHVIKDHLGADSHVRVVSFHSASSAVKLLRTTEQ